MLGLSGVSSDVRDVLALAREPTAGFDDRQQRALDVYLWRLKKYLGAYLALVGSARAIIFTDTIGERVPAVRWAVCSGLEVFGVRLDRQRNDRAKTLPAELSEPDSPVRVFAIATNEELAIARRSYALCLRPAA